MRLVLEITDGYARLLDLLARLFALAFRKRIDPLLEEDPECFFDPLFFYFNFSLVSFQEAGSCVEMIQECGKKLDVILRNFI